MSNARSRQLKAAWDRARKYAAEHDLSVRKARSILAKQGAAKPKATSQSSAKTPAKTAAKGAQSASADLAAAEAALRKKYPHIVAGSIQAHDDGPHKGRRTVEIACKAVGCQNIRLIHTSDAFQVELCPSCTKIVRQQRRTKMAKKTAP